VRALFGTGNTRAKRDLSVTERPTVSNPGKRERGEGEGGREKAGGGGGGDYRDEGREENLFI
jgi:hypothetical protein